MSEYVSRKIIEEILGKLAEPVDIMLVQDMPALTSFYFKFDPKYLNGPTVDLSNYEE